MVSGFKKRPEKIIIPYGSLPMPALVAGNFMRGRMGGMTRRFQFGMPAILKATIWLAIACLIVRTTARVFAGVPIGASNILYIAAASAFVLAPFAAVGAMFDRMGAGVLWGLVFIIAMAVVLRGL
jgi:hypothetical protein